MDMIATTFDIARSFRRVETSFSERRSPSLQADSPRLICNQIAHHQEVIRRAVHMLLLDARLEVPQEFCGRQTDPPREISERVEKHVTPPNCADASHHVRAHISALDDFETDLPRERDVSIEALEARA